MGSKLSSKMSQIPIPNELHERSKLGVAKAKSEMGKSRILNSKNVIALVASILILFGSYGLIKNFNDSSTPESQGAYFTEDGGLHIPALQLPEKGEGKSMDMIGLIVYNGKIYTQTATEIDVKDAVNLLGEKLGRTKGIIDEWSKQDAYADEFASSIGESDVYTVKGYDKDFRIMTYDKYEDSGEVYAEFYEALNGITIYSGEDFFGKLNIAGNIVHAQYRTYSDWNHSIDNFFEINDKKILNSFIEELNTTSPITYETINETLGNYRNDQQYRELILELKDGSKVHLVIIKDGYIRYDHLYFKMEDEIFTQMWKQLE